MIDQPTYCPICAHELSERDVGGRLRPACNNCGYVHFVNPVPGVGLLIEKDGGVVLIQRGHPPHKGEWTLPSGFVEADESAEEAAIREAKEETGLDVEIVELASVNSFPEGPPTSGIMIFYRMRPVGGDLQAGDDAVDVRVFQPDDLPLLPFRTHREMIAEWLEQYHPASVGMREVGLQSDADYVIRRAQRADFEEVLALLMMIPANRAMTEAQHERAMLRFQESVGLEVYVAETKQSPSMIIGFVAVSVTRALTKGIGVIDDMAVLPTYQRRGVGAALLEAVMQRAEQANIHTLLVNTQRGNVQAQAFYAALGFKENGVLHIDLRKA